MVNRVAGRRCERDDVKEMEQRDETRDEGRVRKAEDVRAKPACGERFPECHCSTDSSPLLLAEN